MSRQEARRFSKITEGMSGSNPLARQLEARISQEGPIPFDKYMSTWLYGGPNQDGTFVPGFYTSGKAVIGNQDGQIPSRDVDFQTPSEKTPLFGYVLAEQLMQMRSKMGNPENFTIVEMGGGNGTLALDILKGIYDKVKKGELEDPRALNTRYVLVDASQELGIRQKKKLKDFSSQIEFVNASGGDLPLRDIEGVFLSVELPDAFPIRMIRNVGTINNPNYQELFIGKGDKVKFSEVWSYEVSDEVNGFLSRNNPAVGEGKMYPVNLEAEKWMEGMGRSLERGFVITADYRYSPDYPAKNYASTAKTAALRLRGKNRFLNKSALGRIDITQGVDFQLLSDAGRKVGLDTLGYVNMEGFLFGLGYDLYMKRIETLEMDHRRYNETETWDLVHPMFPNSWDVLIQSKGIEPYPKFASLNYFYNPDREKEVGEIRTLKVGEPVNL